MLLQVKSSFDKLCITKSNCNVIAILQINNKTRERLNVLKNEFCTRLERFFERRQRRNIVYRATFLVVNREAKKEREKKKMEKRRLKLLITHVNNTFFPLKLLHDHFHGVTCTPGRP